MYVRLEGKGQGETVLKGGSVDHASWHTVGGGSQWQASARARNADYGIHVSNVAPERPTGATLTFGPNGGVHEEYRGGVQDVISSDGGLAFGAQGGSVIFHGEGGQRTTSFGKSDQAYDPGLLIVQLPFNSPVHLISTAPEDGHTITISAMTAKNAVFGAGTTQVRESAIDDGEVMPGAVVDFDADSFGRLPEDIQAAVRPLVTVGGQAYQAGADDTRGERPFQIGD